MNRKERRKMEKNMGLLKYYNKLSESKKREIRNRKMLAGKEIHLQNLQEEERVKSNKETEKYANAIQNLMEEGKTYEDAEQILQSKKTSK